MRNTTLAAAISAVMQQSTPAQYGLSIMLISSSNTSYTFTPTVIETMLIAQDYIGEYTDTIQMEFRISTADYADLFDQIQNLMAVLTITYLTYDARPALSIPPIQRQYKVTVVNPKDVRKQVVDAHLRTTPDNLICIKLIEPVVYPIRQIRIHGIYQSTTLSGVCRHIAQSLNIKNLQMVPLDNTHQYDHVTIPPFKDISNIYLWLHSTYGLYMKGVNFYFTNNRLYIYAPFDTTPTFPNAVTIYQAEEGAYAGATSFHKLSGNDIEIVSNSRPTSQDLSQAGSENRGTAMMFLRASTLVDGIVNVDPTNGAQFNPDAAISVRLNTANLVDSSNQNSYYGKATDNPFSLASVLAERQALMTEIDWPHGIPFKLSPGGAVTYISDENSMTVKRTGIVESVRYAFGRADRNSATIMYVCMAKVKLRLQPAGTKI